MVDISIKLKNFLASEAKKLGFAELGICAAGDNKQQAENLKKYLALNYHGEMAWLERTAKRRGDVKKIMPSVESIIVLAMNYAPDFSPLDILQKKSKGAISVYAQNRDYHDVVKGKLKTLAAKFSKRTKDFKQLTKTCEVKVFVDTAPIMEKPLAMAAAIGWQGKHTNLVSKKLGSWFFLGEIFTNIKLPSNEIHKNNCGSCNSCLTICPTNAFVAPYKLDARKCISYLTIEHKGLIEEQLMAKMGNRIYGCDDCLAICPWNKFATKTSEIKLQAKGEADELAELLKLDEQNFRKKFAGSPIKRIGRNSFIRNCLIAAGNSGNKKLKACIEPLLHDRDAIIVQTAKWALAQL